MNYWITTHWPHPIRNEFGEHPWFVYLKRPEDDQGIRIDDKVIFYQTLTGPKTNPWQATWRSGPIESPVGLEDGAGGTVGIATILAPVTPWPNEGRFFYGVPGDGYSESGLFYAECSEMQPAANRILYRRIIEILGLVEKQPPHTFPLNRIDRDTFTIIQTEMQIRLQ